MRSGFYSLLLLLAIGLLASCSPKGSEMIIAEYGDTEVTLGEFEKAYARNVGGLEQAKEDSVTKMKDFLDLFVNFKMKLRDAEVRGFATDTDLKDELDSYKKRVGASYIMERQVINPGMKKFYDMRTEELRVSHIWISNENTSKEEAKKKAYEVMDSIKAGVDFGKMAQLYSSDRFSKQNGGDIYWISAGMIKFPQFEIAVYNTPVGQVYPQVVETPYGYHILKVTDRQPKKYKIKASHILAQIKSPADTMDAYNKILEVQKKIEAGEDFAKLATEYSDDKGSAVKGGDLGFFDRRMMVQPFDEAAFKLKVGEVSAIVKTQFGYHIIKLTDIQEYPSFAKEKEQIKDRYKKIYYPSEKQAFLDSLKIAYKYSLSEAFLKVIDASKDTAVVSEDLLLSQYFGTIKDSVVYSCGDIVVKADSLFAQTAKDNSFKGQKVSSDLVKKAAEKSAEELVVELAAYDLPKYDTEYAALMDDYKNGIYVFKLQEEEVWNKINIDSNQVKAYYDEHKDEYKTVDKVEFAEIMVREDSLAQKYSEELKAGADFEEMAGEHTARPGFRFKKGNHGLVEVKGNELAEVAFKMNKEGDVSEPMKFGKTWSIIKLIKKDPVRTKTLDEARAEISSKLQDMESKRLEEEYLKSLQERYTPTKYYEVLNSAYKEEAK